MANQGVKSLARARRGSSDCPRGETIRTKWRKDADLPRCVSDTQQPNVYDILHGKNVSMRGLDKRLVIFDLVRLRGTLKKSFHQIAIDQLL